MSAPQGASSFSSADFDLNEWLQRHGRKTAWTVGILAVVAVGTWAYVSSESRKEAFASQALMQARAEAESGNLPLAATDLTRLIERYGGTDAADEAVVLLNQTRLVQGQRDIAVNALKQFVGSRGHSSNVKASAYALLGGALDDQGKPRDAAEAYRNAARYVRLDFMKAGYLIDAARAFVEAKDSTAAKAAYTEVLTKYGRLDQAAEARVRMAELGGDVPPPPPPKDTSTAG